jgi:hypothetical protein
VPEETATNHDAHVHEELVEEVAYERPEAAGELWELGCVKRGWWGHCGGECGDDLVLGVAVYGVAVGVRLCCILFRFRAVPSTVQRGEWTMVHI